MAHEILSVKLRELDQHIARMRSRIQLCDSGELPQIKKELELLERECAENNLNLSQNLRFSKAPFTASLSRTYEQIEQLIRQTAGELQPGESSDSAESMLENQILLAEYALDFAMQSADRALLFSMRAIDAEASQQKQEENKQL